MEDVILRDSGTWGVHLVASNHLRFTNCKLISNTRLDDPGFPWEMNTDGFDPDNSSQIMIDNNFISCNDDAIAVKPLSHLEPPPSRYERVRIPEEEIVDVVSLLRPDF